MDVILRISFKLVTKRIQKMYPRSNFDKRVYLGGVGKTYKSIKKTMEGDSA